MIIKNGTIYDGIHPAPYAGDLALREGVIAAIGPANIEYIVFPALRCRSRRRCLSV